MKPTPQGHVLVGIVSWGLPTCGVGHGLGAYTDVRVIRPFINRFIVELGL